MHKVLAEESSGKGRISQLLQMKLFVSEVKKNAPDWKFRPAVKPKVILTIDCI